jgi:hypothetical protein
MTRRSLSTGAICFLLGGISLALAQTTGLRPEKFISLAWSWSGAQTFSTVDGTVVTEATTARTVSAADCGKTILWTNSGANVYTTLNSILPGCAIAVEQGVGAGQVTITNGSGATQLSAHAFTKTFGVGAILGLFVDTNAGGSAAHYILTGDGLP